MSNILKENYGIPLPWEDGLPVLPDIIPAPNYAVDELLMNRYKVKKLLKGSMGDVYHCLDTRRATEVALKTIISTEKENHNRMLSFSNEIDRILHLPAHPNVITFQRIEIIDGYYYIVTEWISGKQEYGNSLSDWLQKHNFSCADIINFMQQLVCGLSHCHKHLSSPNKPYVFGDIKPDNILITENGILKLGDFSGGYTEGWCAPELSEESIITPDERSDIYGLARTATEMLGRTSIIKETEEELRDAIYSLLKHCLKYNIEKRMSSLEALQSELEILCTRFHLDSYNEKKTPPTPFLDKYNRIVSAVNLSLSCTIYDPLKDNFKVLSSLSNGGYLSLNDFQELVSDEKKLYYAKCYYLQGNFDNALKELDGHLHTSELLHLKSSILYSQGKLEDAIHYLIASILKGDHLPSYDLIATILLDFPNLRIKYKTESLSMLDRLTKLPKNKLTGYLPYQVTAKFYMLCHDLEFASSYFRRCLQYPNPNDIWLTLYYYGYCEYQANNITHAQTILNHAIHFIMCDNDYPKKSYKNIILFFCTTMIAHLDHAKQLCEHLKSTWNYDYSGMVETLQSEHNLFNEYIEKVKYAESQYSHDLQMLQTTLHSLLKSIETESPFSNKTLCSDIVSTIASREAYCAVQNQQYETAKQVCDIALSYDCCQPVMLQNRKEILKVLEKNND